MKILHCDIRWVDEIYPFKKGIVKLIQKFVEVPLILKCIDFCNTFIDDNHHLSQYFKKFLVCEQH
jgi:hypothetical protein